MASIVLKETLSGKISVEDIISWLTTTEVKNSKWDHIDKLGCSQCDFIIYFLNFLRDQTKSILHGSYNVRQTPTKTIQSHVIASSDDSENEIKKLPRRVSLFNTSANQIPESGIDSATYDVSKVANVEIVQESQTQSKGFAIPKKELSPISSVGRFKKKVSSVDANAIKELQVLLSLHNTNEESQASSIKSSMKTPDKVIVLKRNSLDSFDISPKTTTTTSTPIIERNSSSRIGKAFNGFNEFNRRVLANDFSADKSCSYYINSNVTSGFCKESANYIGDTENLDNSNENIDISNSLLTSKQENVSQVISSFARSENKDSNSANKSLMFDNCNNDWYRLNNSNISSKSRSSITNESDVSNVALFNGSCETAISPLHTNTPKTPQNSKLYSKSVERCQNSKSSPQHNVDMTPKQGSHHVQRGLKSTPRQNASLGDFISIDTRSAQRNSARKTNARHSLSRTSEGEGSVTDKLSVTEDSFPEIGKNSGRRKRRIKPTKLDVSDGKGTGESSTFGVISRPQIANPQFLEAMPTDKSDTLPFETERDLLRLERQKQQKSLIPNPLGEQTIHPNLSKAPNTVKKSTGSLLVPSLEHVENQQALDTLVKIYSSLLDYNLILNPMTELSFVISLITLQHSFDNDKNKLNSDRYCVEEKRDRTNSSDESSTDKEEKTKECVNIELLNEELGCKILNDVILITKDDNVSNDGKDFDNLTKSSIDRDEINFTKEPQSTTEENKNINRSDDEYFQTIHNCVYFSTSFLNTQRVLLSLLDRATLKILSENNRIATFLPDLQEYLNTCYKLKLKESNRLKQHVNAFSTTEANVSFQIDTDNHENFPSLGGFQNFKKQRDLFYEVLRIWEVNHLTTGWKFSISLAGKIRSLLTLHNDATNYCHFVRLFKSQLLLSCIGNGPQEDAVDDESFSLLKWFKCLDPGKLTRLRERLVTPISSKGPVPPPSFPGVQEFYKDFILHALNFMFYAHLQDCLVHEIMELNDTQFTASEIEETETVVDEETKHNFITCISSLRLLAKFLGFLVSLPYRQCETSAVESVLSSQLELRSQVLPPLNLQFCLQNAIANGKLALTVPWVVKYLAMLDPVSLRLPYYRTVLEILCYIYCESKPNSGLDNPLSSQVIVLLKFSIGWLFALCNFPEKLYFNCRVSQYRRKFKSISNFSADNLRSTLAIQLSQLSNLDQSGTSGSCADSLEIVNERTLYVCCPFLTELKTLLTADQSNLNNSAPIRHITPVSSGFDKPIGSSGSKQLQLQLEEAFFHGQPVSTRKTVDFISERVASSCVKHICNSVLPPAREKNSAKFQNLISQRTLPDDIEVFKPSMSVEMHSIASSLSTELKSQCEADILGMCGSRVAKSIDSLLAEDTVPSVKKMCSEIAIRMSMERINNWIQSHIVGGSLFVKDMELEIDKAYRNKSATTNFEKRIHNANAASPTDVIIDIRSLIWELLDNKGESVTLETVLKSLDNVYESLTERADLLPGPEKIIGSISVDFALFLVAHKADILVPEAHEKFIRIWKMECLSFLKSEAILARILSPRNIMLLASPGNNNVWLPLGELIRKMLKEGVLDIETLSDQCTVLLRYEWPAEILKHLSTCLTEGIKDFKSTDEESERMKLLLEWIAETCNDMEFIYD